MPVPRPTKLRSQRDINLWRIPLQLSLVAVALFVITLIPDVLDKYGVIHIPSWLTMGSIDDARAILSAMMGAVATVLALIFSVALLVLSMVSTLFGPRLLYRFLQDWVTQTTIGLFMATFVYICLVFLVTHQDPQSSFIPQISLITSWVLVVLSFGFLVYYSHRVASSIQNPDMIGAIVDDLYVAAGSAHVAGPGEGTGPVPNDDAILRQAETGAMVSCSKSGYLQHVDHRELVAAARAADALIVLRFRPGQFVLRGEPLAAVVPEDNVATLKAAIDRGIHIGRHRTLTQDSEFGIAQVVEIAIRALSPAVNDTFTGVACVDWLADALLTLAERPPLEGNWFDTSSRLRVWMPPVRLERLAKLAFDQIRQASATTPAVLIRQLETILRLAPRLPDACRQVLSEQADAIREIASALVALDRHDLDAAWHRAHSALGALPRSSTGPLH
ncbi:MAG TPA: DUF2254 domain-containing protein [Terriglobales bacterium]|jgi:uncharacterized membrane protein|nr:DUF2254 domain-containing protein [Terriglobales bacterium]